jgi:alpha-tubulin suppressor-like RCC1 family protein
VVMLVGLAVVPSVQSASATTTRIIQISAGNDHTCALTASGTVKCWGYNEHGELGNGTTTDSPTPIDVVGLSGDATYVSAGAHDTCAVLATGGAECWGYNGNGELGDGTTDTHASPTPVSGLSDVRTISTGMTHTCAVTTANDISCWGDDAWGELGSGVQGSASLTPAAIDSLAGTVADVSTGSHVTCALLTSGGTSCWGNDSFGQLGDNQLDPYSASPVDVTGLDSGVSSLATGVLHSCAVNETGGAECWGRNAGYGAIGDGTENNALTPVTVSGLSTGVTAIGAGSYASCAVVSGSVSCWGLNQYHAELTSLLPFTIPGIGNITSVSVGDNHACALDASGAVYCWGWNGHGQLGDGSYSDSLTPSAVPSLPGTYQPDALISASRNGPIIGKNVFESVATTQKVSAKVSSRSTHTFYIRVANDASGPDSFIASGTSGNRRFRIRYFRGAADVTSDVVGGLFQTPVLKAGARLTLLVLVTATRKAPRKSRGGFVMTFTSAHLETRIDSIRANVRVE